MQKIYSKVYLKLQQCELVNKVDILCFLVRNSLAVLLSLHFSSTQKHCPGKHKESLCTRKTVTVEDIHLI